MSSDDDLPERLQRSPEAAVRVGDLLAVLDVVDRRLLSSEARVTAEVATLRKDTKDAGFIHAQEHIRQDAVADAFRIDVRRYIDKEELSQAYRDGMLGFFRFVLGIAHRYWKGLAIAAGLVLGLTGHVSIGVGTP